MRSVSLFLMLALAVGGSSACAKRLPSQARAEGSIQHFFTRYAKKYPATVFGKEGVKKVEIVEMREIRKGVAVVQAYVVLMNGDLRKINATLQRKSFTWKFISWENPEGA